MLYFLTAPHNSWYLHSTILSLGLTEITFLLISRERSAQEDIRISESNLAGTGFDSTQLFETLIINIMFLLREIVIVLSTSQINYEE